MRQISSFADDLVERPANEAGDSSAFVNFWRTYFVFITSGTANDVTAIHCCTLITSHQVSFLMLLWALLQVNTAPWLCLFGCLWAVFTVGLVVFGFRTGHCSGGHHLFAAAMLLWSVGLHISLRGPNHMLVWALVVPGVTLEVDLFAGQWWTLATILALLVPLIVDQIDETSKLSQIQPWPLLSFIPLLSACLSFPCLLLSRSICSEGCQSFVWAAKHFSSEEELRLWVQSRHRPFIFTNSNGDILFANCSALKVLKYELKDLVGASLEKIVSNMTRVMSTNHCWCCTGGGAKVIDKENRTASKVLASKWVRVDDGARYLVLLFELHEDTDMNVITRFATAVPDAIITAGVDMRIRQVNTAACRLFGYEDQELLGSNVNVLMRRELGEVHQNLVQRYLQTAKRRLVGVGSRMVQGVTKSGQLIPIGLSMNEFHLNEEMLFVAVMHDLRTATGKTEEEYTGMLFHELRNPFSRVSNGIDFLLYRLQEISNSPLTSDMSDEVTKEFHQELQGMSTASQHVIQLLNNILDMSKLQVDKLTLEEVPFNLADVCNVTSVIIQGLIGPGCNYISQVPPGPGLRGSPRHLKQVLINLLSNATKHTRHGFVKLRVILLEQTEDSVYYQFQICDTGCGIPMMDQARLFQKYSAQGQQKGTGLGLFLSQKLVNLMGGEINVMSPWVEGVQSIDNPDCCLGVDPSKRIDGSTFYFNLRFPIHHTLQESKSADENQSFLPTDIGVLVVDDIEANRMLLKRILTKMGRFKRLNWKVDEAVCGEDALEMIKTAQPRYCVIMLDENMGEGKMKGTEVTRKIRDWEHKFLGLSTKDQAVVVGVTGNCTAKDRYAGLGAGQDLFWGKPLPKHEQIATDIASVWEFRGVSWPTEVQQEEPTGITIEVQSDPG
eukprot:GGOE01007576.1.p1 GENE.GGOE01007576.1~~GGOE01007576.1.p1  ORF type:complete len:894 (-),score=283.43 GGOE01007576.1:1605-4286(-)